MATAKCLFRYFCVLLAIITSIWPIYLFSLNKDSVQIEYKEFYSSKDRIYPALTLCYDHTTFHKFNQTSKNTVGNDMERQVFSNQPTLDIEDYVNSIVIKDMMNNQTRFTRSGGKVAANVAIIDKDLSLNTVLRRYQSTSCFAIGVPFFNEKGINSMNVGIRKSLFKDGTVPTRNQLIHGKSQLNIGFSYQNRHFPLVSRDTKTLRSHDSMNNICSGLVLKVRGMEIVSRRSKPSNPCNDYGDDETLDVLNDAAIDVGCVPRGWELDSMLPVCQARDLNVSTRQIFDDSLYNSNARHLIRPCRSVVDVWYHNFDEAIDSCTDEPDTLHITIVYNNLHFKDMKFVRAYTIWDLISSLSVIIGLYLGVSVIQLPDMMSKALGKKKKRRDKAYYEARRATKVLITLIEEIENIKREMLVIKPLNPLLLQTSTETLETTV